MNAQKPLWQRPTWWIAAAVAARNAGGLRQIRQTLQWVDQTPGGTPSPMPTSPMVLHVVIPVLREQQQIAGALTWFVPLLRDYPGSTLTLVSTDREGRERDHLVEQLVGAAEGDLTVQRFPQLADDEIAALAQELRDSGEDALTRARAASVLWAFPLTAEVVDWEMALVEQPAPPIRHVRYEGDGRKAAQVNAAVEQLGAASAAEYIAIYDVDSRPSAELLRRTAEFLGSRQAVAGELPFVVQQSARFVTQDAAATWWERSLCRGAARAQTLWTIRREIPNLRHYARSVRRPARSPLREALTRGLAQTVGHGLLVRADVYRAAGGLPMFTVLDDVAFGYRLTMGRIPVDSVPFTSAAAAAEYLPELLSQSERWFQCYLDYPHCAVRWHGQGHGTRLDHAAALGVGVYRGMAWLLVSLATAACLALALGPRTSLPVRATAAAALWMGVVVPVRLLAEAEGRPLTARETARQSAETLAGTLLKSVGPMIALARWAATGSRHSVLAPKSNRRTGSPTTQDREIP
ncbi:hypothetical protein OG500_19265 [Kitasatospora sp. NBC_01250]|uniref:hypothetical protein n=1 Tax=Kitasatospora sp. NBC_01250 TaxID=2903571 RepID=UPI002E32E870|nr:hypothetical protein [Kitasatospora sp. NBC_01250]